MPQIFHWKNITVMLIINTPIEIRKMIIMTTTELQVLVAKITTIMIDLTRITKIIKAATIEIPITIILKKNHIKIWTISKINKKSLRKDRSVKIVNQAKKIIKSAIILLKVTSLNMSLRRLNNKALTLPKPLKNKKIQQKKKFNKAKM